MTSDDELVLDFSPPLVTLLLHAERRKGARLTEAEVLDIRDGATAMAVPRSLARAMAEARGYDDLDPEHAWAEWQQVRAELGDS